MSESAPRRVATLDVLRALAIVLVVFHHTDFRWAMTGVRAIDRFTGVIQDFGWVGVDLFFILSGWLIGGLYFKEEATFGDVRVGRFWARRWFRTLPPYYLVFALLAAERVVRGYPWRFDWREIVFLQNFLYHRGFDATVRVSWSLCIEEQFYLFLPIVLFLTASRRAYTLVGIPVLVLGTMALRTAAYVADANYSHFYFTGQTHFRIDTLMIGVWLACARYHHPDVWAAIQRHSRAIGIAGFAGLVLIARYASLAMGHATASPFIHSVGYTIIGLCFAGLLVEATGKRSILAYVPGRIATPIALASYSMYLTHRVIGDYLRVADNEIRFLAAHPGYVFFMYIGLTGLFAAICYHAVEKPAIVLRDRFYPRRQMRANAAPAIADARPV